MTYPSAHTAGLNPYTGKTYTYGYDAAGRPDRMTDVADSTDVVTEFAYNGPSAQLTQFRYYGVTESRGYNVLGQLISESIASYKNITYTYSGTQTNGRITQMTDAITGEQINYAYDALNRLSAAETTGPQWGLSFTYDGFGNKTAQAVTKGSGPWLSLAVSQSTNRVVGINYDANGNQLLGDYDVLNRLVARGDDEQGYYQYGYDPSNKRIYQKHETDETEEEIYFYGADGLRLGTYTMKYQGVQPVLYFFRKSENIYFGSKLVRSGDQVVVTDRLGSVRYDGEHHSYFPYGEEKTSTTQLREKFATYFRDGDLDYADQRYYQWGWGRFTSPDPIRIGSNLYSYSGNDPVNRNDPTGLAWWEGARDFFEQWDGGGLDAWGMGWGEMFQMPDSGSTLPPCGFGYGTVCGFEPGPLPLPAPGPQPVAPRRPLPKYLLLINDCYVEGSLKQGGAAERHVSYQLYGDDDEPIASAIVTEVLRGDLPMKGSKSGPPGGRFDDMHSILGGKDPQQIYQTFTVTTIYNYVSPALSGYPVFVRGFGGDWSELSVYKTKSKVIIQGDDGFDPKTGLPRKICGPGE